MRDYQIRASQPEDEPRLTALFEQVFGERRSAAEWHWKFIASRALLGGMPAADSLVAADAEGQIIAHAGAVTLPGWWRDQTVPFVQVCDVMVHPGHRGGIGRGNLFTCLLRELLERVAASLPTAWRYGFPGEGPYLVGERARVYERIETCVDLLLEPRRPTLPIWSLRPLDWQDARIDVLWRRVRGSIGLSLVRDTRYLQWRYQQHPKHSYQIHGIQALGTLRGWVVSRTTPEALLLVDCLLPPWRAAVALGVVADQLLPETQTPQAILWVSGLPRAACRAQARTSPVVCANMRWQSGIATATARQNLYYCMGDVDIF